MSSYIIAKEEFMKAAGLVAGLAKGLDLWIYDYETGRNSIEEDYKRKFSQFYEMNCLSVTEQYHGDEVGAPAHETDEYSASFSAYYKIGRSLCMRGGKALLKAIRELQQFFSSVIYQTEKYEYMFMMQFFFDRIISGLYKQYFKLNDGQELQSWGELVITPQAS